MKYNLHTYWIIGEIYRVGQDSKHTIIFWQNVEEKCKFQKIYWNKSKTVLHSTTEDNNIMVAVISVIQYSVKWNGVLTFVFPVSWLSWSCSYGSWIYNYLCNQWISPPKFEFRSWRGALDTTLCDKVYQWLAIGLWFFSVTPFPPPIKLTTTV